MSFSILAKTNFDVLFFSFRTMVDVTIIRIGTKTFVKSVLAALALAVLALAASGDRGGVLSTDSVGIEAFNFACISVNSFPAVPVEKNIHDTHRKIVMHRVSEDASRIIIDNEEIITIIANPIEFALTIGGEFVDMVNHFVNLPVLCLVLWASLDALIVSQMLLIVNNNSSDFVKIYRGDFHG